MKLALITDQHFGARSDNLVFDQYFEKFYTNVFIPYLIDNGITNVIDLGDTYDHRKFTNHQILSNVNRYYFSKLDEANIKLHIIVGNHTAYYKNTIEVDTVSLHTAQFKNVSVINKPTELTFDSCKMLLIPWICNKNHSEIMDSIKSTNASILLGHLELAGFEFQRGTFAEHGHDFKLFNKFDIVYSGHYHHKSHQANITYLGTPYELTWADYDDPKGFHVFDTETHELTFVKNPYTMFNKVYYDDSNWTIDDVQKLSFDHLTNTHIKLIVQQKNNPYWFDMVWDKLDKVDPLSLQSIDDSLYLGLDDVIDINKTDTIEDISVLINNCINCIDGIECNDKEILKLLLTNLYNSANIIVQGG